MGNKQYHKNNNKIQHKKWKSQEKEVKTSLIKN